MSASAGVGECGDEEERTPAAIFILAVNSDDTGQVFIGGGLGHKINRAPHEGLDSNTGAPLRGGAEHDDRRRALGHDAPQRGQTIHTRHLHVERDHVGMESLDLAQRIQPVVSLAHHSYAGIDIQPLGQPMAHKGRVIHYQDANRLFHPS